MCLCVQRPSLDIYFWLVPLDSSSYHLKIYVYEKWYTLTSQAFHFHPLNSWCDGNMIAARTLVLCYIAAALAAWWVLEQPTNSIMEELPCFKWFTRQVSTFRHSINMCDYGGPTKKPTWLYSGFLGVNLVLEDQHFCFISLNVFVPKFRVFGGTICYRFRIWSHATPNATPI